MKELAAWTVRGILPMDHEKNRRWNQNVQCTAIATSAERAIVAARKRYPDIFVHAVNHIGAAVIFEEP